MQGREGRGAGKSYRGHGLGRSGRQNDQQQFQQQQPQHQQQYSQQRQQQSQYHHQEHAHLQNQAQSQQQSQHHHQQLAQSQNQLQQQSQQYWSQFRLQQQQFQRPQFGPRSGVPNWRPGVGEGSSSSSASGGQQQLSGGEDAAKLRQFSHSATDRGLDSDMKSLKVSDTEKEKKVPVKRPDSGGLANIRTVNILVNHFPVMFNDKSSIGCYDVDILPAEAPTRDRPVKKISKANRRLILENLFAQSSGFPAEMTAYDGDRFLFSPVKLSTGEFSVSLSAEEDVKCCTYKITVEFLHDLKLKDYLTGNLQDLPREVLQAMDIVMKENPRKHMRSIGKSFHPIHPRDSSRNRVLVASEGFQHSLKPTSQGLALCLDCSVLSVLNRVPVLQFLKEHFNLHKVSSDSFCEKREDIENVLKGLKVTVTHRRTKQKYTILGLTDQNACDISFTVEDPDGQQPPTNSRLLDYFKDKYPKLLIEYSNIPCLSFGRGNRSNYVPIELCVLVEGQRYPLDSLYNKSVKELRISPKGRRNKICEMLHDKHGPAGGEISRNFGIDVSIDMTQVKGRVIEPPKLKFSSAGNTMSAVSVNKDSCHWNLSNKSVVEGKSLLHWAVLDLTSNEKQENRLKNEFIQKLVKRCHKLGMHVELPMFIENSNMTLESVESVTSVLQKVKSRTEHCGGLQLILCVMAKKGSVYKFIKYVSETKIGVVTQCCLVKLANKGQDQYLANLGMKINAKLGGSNVELFNQLTLPTKDADGVMLIGADVNHPAPLDTSSLSIAAVVASLNWPAATKYVPCINRQDHRVEKIKHFGRSCLQLIEYYEKHNGAKPKRLVIFRDGVSEGQFNMVLNEELSDLLEAMEKVNYHPTITLVVAGKRHQTRLFPETSRDEGRDGNIPPGTVVDTTIVHPSGFDFYLCSHHGSIGTSKPTHYHVLWDENGFTSDKLQKFIYDLCFTWSRCCNPVSLAPPVYYADRLAYRGRQHYDAQFKGLSTSGHTSSSSTSATLSEYAYELHADIKNSMYFI